MAFSQRFMWNVDRQLRDLAERKKKRQLFDQDMQRREMREKEKTGALGRKIARGEYENKQANERTNFFTKMQRDSDAFEVSAGRKDPAYFNMKYGGGASSGGGVSSVGSTARSGGGNTNQPDYATMLIDAYKAAGDIDGMKEDFLSFSKKVLPQLQKDFPATEQPIDPWELRRKKNAMDYGSRTTKDFQDNMTTSRTPEGALRFSDNGVREGDIKLAQGWNDQTENIINRQEDSYGPRRLENFMPEKKTYNELLTPKSLRDYEAAPAPRRNRGKGLTMGEKDFDYINTPNSQYLSMEDFEDPSYVLKMQQEKKRREEEEKKGRLQTEKYLKSLYTASRRSPSFF